MAATDIDHAVRDTATGRPRLRRDIRTYHQQLQGKPIYVLEDRANGKFYQVGFPEHQFIQALNGSTTVAEALARNARTQGQDALTERQSERLMRWLVDNELLETTSADQAERHFKHWRDRETGGKKQSTFAKMLYFKFSLGCPDLLLMRLTPFLGWIFGWFGLILWLGLMVWAGFILGQSWDSFRKASLNVMLPSNWFSLGLVYLFLKLFHEMGHGLATRRFGGAVPEWGVRLLFFVTPLTYADASASWRFSNKWKRIVVSSAGMYVELGIAAICLILWARTSPGIANTMLHNAVIAASTITLLFNANPLMRFDGYYILADFLGIPNLGAKGQQFLGWLSKWLLLGMRELPIPPGARQRPVAVPIYGVLAWMWRIVIILGIVFMLSLFLKGAGIILAATVLGGTLFGFVMKVFKLVWKGEGGHRPKPSRLLVHWSVIGVIFFGLFYGIRVEPTERALAVVEFADKLDIRARCPGTVTEVLVEPDQWVEEGQLLARLHNLEKETALEQLRLDVKVSRVQTHRYLLDQELAAYQAEQENLNGLRRKLEEEEVYTGSLQVRAPSAGRIVARNLQSLKGRWLVSGEEILSVASSESKHLVLSVRQKDVDYVRTHASLPIRCMLRGWESELAAFIERIDVTATRAVPNQVLTTQNGGPLPVRTQIDPRALREGGLASGGGDYDTDLDHFAQLDGQKQSRQELVRPRFAAWAKLNDEASVQLHEGEWGYARFSHGKQIRLGLWLYEKVFTYIRGRIDEAAQSMGGGGPL